MFYAKEIILTSNAKVLRCFGSNGWCFRGVAFIFAHFCRRKSNVLSNCPIIAALDYYYLESNLSMVLLVKKTYNIALQSLNMKKQLSLMGLFQCLSHMSMELYSQRMKLIDKTYVLELSKNNIKNSFDQYMRTVNNSISTYVPTKKLRNKKENFKNHR